MSEDTPLATAETRIAAVSRDTTELDLSFLELGTIPDSVRKLTHLRSLDISRCELSQLPDWLGELTELRLLNVSYNHELKSLPESIGSLTILKRLDAGFCAIEALPETLKGFAQLTSLDLGGNRLSRLPTWLGACPALEELPLYQNRLHEYPEVLAELPRLTRLILDENRLTELPEAVGKQVGLTSITLRENELSALPEQIGELAALTELKVDGNKITQLPESIGRLRNLISLDLSRNRLQALPEALGRLTQLRGLHVRGNELRELPAFLEQLTELRSLGVAENRLRQLPATIVHLPHLERLSASENPLPIDQLMALRVDGLAGLRALLSGGSVQPFDFQQLRREIRDGTRKAFAALRARRPKDTFYAYALNTDDSIMGISPAANCEEFFEKAAKKGRPDYRLGYRWMLAEWGHEATGCDYLPGIEGRLTSADLGRPGDPDRGERFDVCVGRTYAAMVQGLQDLDAEGFFGTGEAREKVTLFCDVSDSHDSAWLMDESAKVLNPPTVYEAFRKALVALIPNEMAEVGTRSGNIHGAFSAALGPAPPV